MKIKILVAFIVFLLPASTLFSQTKKYVAEKGDSYITYKITHPLHEVEAKSKNDYCVILADAAKKEIKEVAVQVDVTSFDSGNSNRDSHAMEVVNAITYPDAQFTSTSVVPKGDSLEVNGKLTFHGITRDISLEVFPSWMQDKLIVNGKFDISLTAFKIKRPSLFLIPINDKCEFTLKQVFDL